MSLGVHIQMQLLRAKRAECATEDEVTLLTGYYESTGSRLMLRLIPVLIRSLTNDDIPIQRRCVLIPPRASPADSSSAGTMIPPKIRRGLADSPGVLSVRRVEMLRSLTRPTREAQHDEAGGDEACARLLMVTNVVLLNPQMGFLATRELQVCPVRPP